MSRPDGASIPSAPSFISNLPNEVLGEIFSHIPMGTVVEWSENGKTELFHQFEVLLRVSTAFRTAAFASHAIYEWNFRLSNLAPFILFIFGPGTLESLRSRFNNEYILQILGRKQKWMIRGQRDFTDFVSLYKKCASGPIKTTLPISR